jgi:hypothetical protein
MEGAVATGGNNEPIDPPPVLGGIAGLGIAAVKAPEQVQEEEGKRKAIKELFADKSASARLKP